MDGKTWLVTGGCGFIGSRLVAALLAQNALVRVVDNLSVGTLADLKDASQAEIDICTTRPLPPPRAGKIQFLEADIVDENAVRGVASDMRVIAHFAANTGVAPSVANPRLDCEINVLGTLNLLEEARVADVERFVFASSGAPVGEVVPPIHEDMAPHPVSPYGASKLAGEAYCSAYARTFGIETVALRFGNVYGPGSGHKSSVVAKFIRDAASSGVITIHGDGAQTRDFIYVDDLVDAVLRSSRASRVGGEIFQIATSRETTVFEIAERMRVVLPRFGIRSPRIVFDSPRKGDVRRNYSDTTKARTRLGWTAETDLESGIALTIRWFQERARQPART